MQRTISGQGLRKDYTEIALRVLSEADTSEQAELRQWAIDVLDKNAPLPFSADVRRQLLGPGILFRHQMKIDVPEEYMQPPREWVEPPEGGFETSAEANKYVTENRRRFLLNANDQDALQQVVRIYQKAAQDLESEIQQIEAQRRR